MRDCDIVKPCKNALILIQEKPQPLSLLSEKKVLHSLKNKFTSVFHSNISNSNDVITKKISTIFKMAKGLEMVADSLYDLPKNYGLIFDIVHYIICIQGERSDLGDDFEKTKKKNPLVRQKFFRQLSQA